ncbi:TlyA family RNA methyltransferase [Roseibium algae]|uniref:TlyA family RNA methyltransferase n=1 Tax=Roseibium algae TaxID=3123038 RepID=A0ABU8TGX3_9HYPH
MTQKQRLDQHLVDLKHFPSRARARDAILRGTVRVDGATSIKPAQKVSRANQISVDDPGSTYVSRAALKLIAGLDEFGIDASERICLDIGASTGGFTQVLLERGAAKVHAIDVGHDQLHKRFTTHPRVSSRDGLNARELSLSDLDGEHPELIVSDVSFISLKLALPPALEFALAGAKCVCLVKPQFEAGRENIGKSGLVDLEVAEMTAKSLKDWFNSVPGWQSVGLIPSPVKGGDGNSEWLLCGQKDG